MSNTATTPANSTDAPDQGDRTKAEQSGAERSKSRSLSPVRRSELTTDDGRTSIADTVVAKIAGLATREVSGVHDMGTGVSRAFGAIKDSLPIGSNEASPTQGVDVEVGERQAAVDLDVVIDYGASIVDVAGAVRRNVIGRVEAMTGLEVTEVNITVDDVHIDTGHDEPARVQ
jgi:uncharacterized alkaline shock family protein YloU